MGLPVRAEDSDGSWIVFGLEGLFRIQNLAGIEKVYRQVQTCPTRYPLDWRWGVVSWAKSTLGLGEMHANK